MLGILNKNGTFSDHEGILSEVSFDDFKDVINNKKIIKDFNIKISKKDRESKFYEI